MGNYSKVQFISWEIHTGPGKQNNNQDNYAGYSDSSGLDPRLDYRSQYFDIQLRARYVMDAVEKAYNKVVSTGDDSTTLKVFMAPEFLMRGAGGAYIQDMIVGWESTSPTAELQEGWTGLVGELKSIVNDKKFNDWVFVFGTALGASYPSVDKSLFERFKASFKQLISGNVAPEQSNTNIDLSKAEVYNNAFVLFGGDNSAAQLVVRKFYKSGIDFVTGPQYGIIVNDQATHLDQEKQKPDDLTVNEGSCIFSVPFIKLANDRPLTFGLEICLDHAKQRLVDTGKNVDIQLVPSGGMSLEADALALETAAGQVSGKYAFNCDGLNNLQTGDGAHTQIWSNTETKPGIQRDQTSTVENEAIPVTDSVTFGDLKVPAAQLWKNNAGSVRVLTPLNLS